MALYSRFGADSWIGNLVYILGLHNPAGWAMLLAAFVGGWWLNRKQLFGTLEAVWLAAMVLFFTFSRTRMFFWYVAPLSPILILFSSASVLWICDRWRMLRDRLTSVGAAVAVMIVVASLMGLQRQVTHFRAQAMYDRDVLEPVAFYLKEQVDPRFQLVAAEDIGHIGYYSDCRILDRDGLVSPEAVEYNRDGGYLDLILDFRPDWVGVTVGSPISGFVDNPEFTENYVLERFFPQTTTPYYHLYRRIK
jgi:hypothetical protein